MQSAVIVALSLQGVFRLMRIVLRIFLVQSEIVLLKGIKILKLHRIIIVIIIAIIAIIILIRILIN